MLVGFDQFHSIPNLLKLFKSGNGPSTQCEVHNRCAQRRKNLNLQAGHYWIEIFFRQSALGPKFCLHRDMLRCILRKRSRDNTVFDSHRHKKIKSSLYERQRVALVSRPGWLS